VRPALAALVLLVACADEDPKYDATETNPAGESQDPPGEDRPAGDGGLYDAVKVMEDHCVACHGPEPDAVRLEDYNMGPAPMLLSADVFCDVVLDDTLVLPADPDRGLLYARMTDTTTPMPPEGALGDAEIGAIKDWIDDGAHCSSGSGALAFRQQCAGCHGQEGEGLTGPTLVNRLEGQTESTVAELILNGTGTMAPVAVSEAEAAELAAYVIGAWGP
jgi:mono/diheme cytochrome c family protein